MRASLGSLTANTMQPGLARNSSSPRDSSGVLRSGVVRTCT
jgi:hypothetical protein